MSAAAPDPSMDDILASIRRIITDDTPPLPSGGAPAPPPFTPMTPEVLELSDPLPEADVPAPPPPLPVMRSDAVPDASDAAVAGLVRDMLRPMLRDWLDANLPALVERLVAEEVRRITAKRD